MSNINVMRKNLGPVTAYKYAVQQGYTGTEQEFAVLMASYATVAEDAAGSASSAASSAAAAEDAADRAEAAAEQAEGAIEVDDTLSVAGRAADSKTVGEKFNAITVTYHPENYAENIDASSLVVASSTLSGKITATDNANGGIDVVNGVNSANGYIGFALDDLPYNTDKVINFVVHLTNPVGTVELYLRRGMAEGSIGATVQTFSADTDGKYITSQDFGNYNYSVGGKLYLCYRIYSSQTTAVNINITAIEQGDVPYSYIDNQVISNLGLGNLSATLQNKINSIDSIASGLDNLTEDYIPTDYADEVGASGAVIATSSLSGNVTVSDDPGGGINIVNSSGVNGIIGIALDDMPYDTQKKIVFTIELTNAVLPVTLDIRRTMSVGNIGAILQSFELGQDGKYTSVFDFGQYVYSTGGIIFIGFNLRYNQTTAVNIKITAIEQGETEKKIYKTDMIQSVGFENLNEDLYNRISVVSGEKPTLYGGKQIATFNKGVAIGDSLTAGVFNHNEGGTNAYITNSAFAYPAKLKQLCGVDLTNLGNGGYASDQWWTAHQSDDLSGNQFAIVQLGVNDAIQYSGWLQTSVTAFTNIINKLLTENNGIFVFVATIIPAVSYRGTAYNAVSEGIRTLVESINNDHVILLDMAEYGNTMNEVGYNNGHLSALGYERLALDYIAYISYMIARNPVLFRNIQFIGTNFSYS